MNVTEWLKQASEKLKNTGIGTARLDCLILLEDTTGKDRTYLLAHPELPVQGSTLYKLNRQILRRSKHEPLAYIRGKCEFYGREFYVDKRVLVPRPESETMVELALNVIGNGLEITDKTRVIDVGTGSGALAITIKLELPNIEVIGTDIDPKCLEVACKNAKKYNANIKFMKGDLLQPFLNSELSTLTSIIMANLPYVPDAYTVNEAAKIEPKIAIFGGEDGLDLYKRFFKQLSQFSPKKLPSSPSTKHNTYGRLSSNKRVDFVLTESLPFQHQTLEKIASKAGYKLQKTDDFIQLFEEVYSTYAKLPHPQAD